MTIAAIFTLLPAIAGVVLTVASIYAVSSILTNCVKTRCSA
jgi:hypothetical protein